MNILMVTAHPDPQSLTHSLAKIAADRLEQNGHQVRHSDLYAMKWKSAVDREDFPALAPSDRLQVASASGQAFASNTLTEDVVNEQEKLLWADAVILSFPLWWFSMPAILKGWIDRTLSYGFGYGVGEHNESRWGDRYGEGKMAGRRGMLIVTVGGWPSHYHPRGINGPIDDILFPINHGVLHYPGFDVIPPVVVYRADRTDEPHFNTLSAGLKARMDELFVTQPIPFRMQNGGDYQIPNMELKDHIAPDVTGFRSHLRL